MADKEDMADVNPALNEMDVSVENKQQEGTDDVGSVSTAELIEPNGGVPGPDELIDSGILTNNGSDTMNSSTALTDGSDVEVLGEDDPESNDSIEVIHHINMANIQDSSDHDSSPPGADSDQGSSVGNIGDTGNRLLFSDCEKLLQSELSSDDARSPPHPVDAVVHVQRHSSCDNSEDVDGNQFHTRSDRVGSGARPKAYGSARSVPSTTHDDFISAVTNETYDLIHNLDMIANGSVNRPDSLSLPRPLQQIARHKQLVRSESESSSWSGIYSHHSSTEALIEAASSTPLHAQGTVMKEGDMIAFVAEDLAEKIRMSSPLAKKESDVKHWLGNRTPSSRSVSSLNSISSSTSGWSSSSASGWSHLSNSGMSRSPSVLTQSPEDIPPIDPRAILELETQACRVAASVDHMLAALKINLHKMSSVTSGCLDAYKDGIDNTCDSVDAAIKSMYALMAKCEELSKTFRPIYQLADQVKEIKRLLDLFESQVAKEELVKT